MRGARTRHVRAVNRRKGDRRFRSVTTRPRKAEQCRGTGKENRAAKREKLGPLARVVLDCHARGDGRNFPAHPNWSMSARHSMYWELCPTIDHVVSVARGGENSERNYVTISMVRKRADRDISALRGGAPRRGAPPANFRQKQAMNGRRVPDGGLRAARPPAEMPPGAL